MFTHAGVGFRNPARFGAITLAVIHYSSPRVRELLLNRSLATLAKLGCFAVALVLFCCGLWVPHMWIAS